jgi:hypothetical protein
MWTAVAAMQVTSYSALLHPLVAGIPGVQV